MSSEPTVPEYQKKDFMSDQTIRWCPGCGDYSILSQVQTTFAKLGILRENIAMISGIGCSSRFPYYMETYGFHTIHGRAPAIATGLKCSRPDLSVWVITGDGDALSIGGNHFIHTLRRNVDLNILLFNNRIYGLTKGQYSPTSEVGKKTKSTPMGSIDYPFNPLLVALGAGGTFVARSVDVIPTHLRDTLEACSLHKGTSFVEIYQNCNIFNDGAFDWFVDRKGRDDHMLFLEAGKPMLFGKNGTKGIVSKGTQLVPVDLGAEYTEADCVVHDPSSLSQAMTLAALEDPVPVGVFYSHSKPTYDAAFRQQVEDAKAQKGNGDLEKLLYGGDTWNVG